MSTTHPERITMNPNAKKAIDVLGTTGILVLIVAAITLGFFLWGAPDAALLAGVLLLPLTNLGALFTGLWLAATAIVEQLAKPQP